MGQALFGEVVLEAERQGLLSDEHFTVDGTLIEAAASLKSFKPKDGDPPRATDADPGNPSVDFHGERRSNATHQSATDPEARLLRKGKGKEARLVFPAHALMETGMECWWTFRPRERRVRRSGILCRNCWSKPGDGAFIPERWAETKATTPGTAWRTCGGAG